MQENDKTFVARTLKECVGYVLKDCEEAGFSLAAIHLRIAMQELEASAPAQQAPTKKAAAH